MTSEDFVAHIKTQYQNQLPFIVYRKPNDVKIKGLFQNTDKLYVAQHFREEGFVFSPFDSIEQSILIPKKHAQAITCFDWKRTSESTDHKAKTEDSLQGSKSKEFHIKLVEKGIQAIKNKDFKKVVLSRAESVALTEVNPTAVFENLLSAYNSALVYCWYHPKVGLWLGATPETLIKIEDRRFSIMALAGTQDYKGSLDVEWKDKEKQEQQFVTDFIVNHLKPLAESFSSSPTKTVKAGNLLHLRTMISARLKPSVLLKEVLQALHPTPAVCGLPKETAKQFILNNENYHRKFYTGFLGELNLKSTVAPRSGKRNIEHRAYAHSINSTQLYVNLRCMQIKDQQAIIYVGGGITESSNPEMEWQETVSKSLVVKSGL